MTYIPRHKLEAFLADNGNKAVTVTFDKKNGETVTKNGLPQVYKRRVGGEAGAKQAQTLKDNGLRFFDYVKPKTSSTGKPVNGFSFFLDRVREVRAGGMVLRAK